MRRESRLRGMPLNTERCTLGGGERPVLTRAHPAARWAAIALLLHGAHVIIQVKTQGMTYDKR